MGRQPFFRNNCISISNYLNLTPFSGSPSAAQKGFFFFFFSRRDSCLNRELHLRGLVRARIQSGPGQLLLLAGVLIDIVALLQGDTTLETGTVYF